MRTLLNQLWRDESGAVLSSELVLVTSILVVGMASALTTVRDAVTGQLADVAFAIQSLNQSYSVAPVVGPYSMTAGSSFTDRTASKFTDNTRRTDYRSWESPTCIAVCSVAMGD